MEKYTVKIRVSVDVEAETPKAAAEQAKEKVADFDMDDIQVVQKSSGYVVPHT